MSHVMIKPASRQMAEAGAGVSVGGYGWVLVGSLFVCVTLVFGVIRSFGILFVELVAYFDESAQAISWITSIGVATQQLFSPVGTALCRSYGTRSVVMAGGCLAGLGLVLASEATSLVHLYLSMGAVSGLGWAMVFAPMMAIVISNLEQRPSLGVGLALSGIGVSSFAFSPLLQWLVDAYTWRGALLILGGLSFNIVPCGALVRPQRTPKEQEKREPESASRPSLLRRACSYLDLPLLLQRPFATYCLAVCFVNAGYFVPFSHLVAHSRQQGLSEYQAAFVMSAVAGADIAGRVASGWFSDLRRVRLVHLLAFWTALTGVLMALLPLGAVAGSYRAALALALLYGFSSGALTAQVFTVVPEIVGMGRLAAALGLAQMLESVAGLLGPPLSGLFRDLTGTYVASLVMAGGFLLVGSVVMATIPHFFCRTDPAVLADVPPAGESYDGLAPSPPETPNHSET